jgi:DNA-binding CsgD family transcriptional regulator
VARITRAEPRRAYIHEAMEQLRSQGDFVGILESLYRVDQPREAWLQGVLQTLSTVFDESARFAGVFYDLADGQCVDSAQVEVLGDQPELQRVLEALHQGPALQRNVVSAYRNTLAATATEFITDVQAFAPICARQFQAGMRDTLLINGASPFGVGCALNVFYPRALSFTDDQRELLKSIAVHLSTAHRLQRKLAAATVEAILTDTGNLEHVDSPIDLRTLKSNLQDAVAQRRWARKRARQDGKHALHAWKGMVERRWTLVDAYETDGKHYIVARCNLVEAPKTPELSEREREVVALAAIGRSNKFIAYELGLAHSTVRVLCHRAMQKLGVTTREALVDRVRAAAQED